MKKIYIIAGHDIPNDTIKRRYKKGLLNFFNIYIPLADEWILIDNSGEKFQVIAEGTKSNKKIKNNSVWLKLQGK